ncbi:phytoene synthase [Limimaricola cinnabarinus LL-001]|uniref:Phytoene synthase n=2 Tax=Limimaricola cinnabarinus TaxID=1125964 RepID=U2Z7V9_9RHOB|nr:phytoene synthase [Limimaricola cinnabarinus LL-001]
MQMGVAEIVSGSGSSFRAGMRVLPAPRRRAILAVYAFCRVVDDVVDTPGPEAEKRAGLDAWEAELTRIREGRPRTPVGREIAHAARAYDLPLEEFDLVIDGMRMDLRGMIAPDAATLDAYVRRVAGAVGILSMHVFGAWRGEASRRFALSLAEALQLTNILRDARRMPGWAGSTCPPSFCPRPASRRLPREHRRPRPACPRPRRRPRAARPAPPMPEPRARSARIRGCASRPRC